MSRVLRAPSPPAMSGARPVQSASVRTLRPAQRPFDSILRIRRPAADAWITVTALFLTCVGVLMVFSASALNSLLNNNDAYETGSRQLLYAVAGCAGLLFLSATDYRRWRVLATPFLMLSLVMLVLVMIPGIPTDGGLRRSLDLGPVSIHAAEVAKLALIIFLAAQLSRRGHALADVRGTILPLTLVIATAVCLVLVEPDLGTAGVLGLIGLSILFSAGIPLRWVLAIGVAGALAALVGIALNEYQSARLGGWMDPFVDPLGSSYQTLQGLMSMALGGPLGTGIGSSQQPGGIVVPYSWNDYIYAVIGQEFGIAGAVLVVLAFMLIAIRGLRVADRAPDTFGALIAVGITTWICGQAFINIGVVLAVLPVTGVPLPFVSQGGSALIVLLAAIGLLLSVSRETMGEAEQGGTDARLDRGRWNRGAPVPRVRYRSFAPPSPYQR